MKMASVRPLAISLPPFLAADAVTDFAAVVSGVVVLVGGGGGVGVVVVVVVVGVGCGDGCDWERAFAPRLGRLLVGCASASASFSAANCSSSSFFSSAFSGCCVGGGGDFSFLLDDIVRESVCLCVCVGGE